MRITTMFFALSIALVVVKLSEAGIKPTSWNSPVIVNQTILGNRSSTFKKAISGHLVRNYTLSTAPVYREGYPLYRCYVTFPEDKAARISYEEEKLKDINYRTLCVGEEAEKQPLQGAKLMVGGFFIQYSLAQSGNRVFQITSHSIDSPFHIPNITQNFEVKIIAQYETAIVNGTHCQQIETTVKGTLVTMYETIPPTTQPATQPTGKSNVTRTVASQSNKMFLLQPSLQCPS